MLAPATPQYQLLKKQARWNWTRDCSTAFEDVKRLIASELVLTHFTPDQQLVLSCDASAYGLGAVMSPNGPGGERPIAFASSTLADSAHKYSQIEKEALALGSLGDKRFQHYLLGSHTDHRSLTSYIYSTPRERPTLHNCCKAP